MMVPFSSFSSSSTYSWRSRSVKLLPFSVLVSLNLMPSAYVKGGLRQEKEEGKSTHRLGCDGTAVDAASISLSTDLFAVVLSCCCWTIQCSFSQRKKGTPRPKSVSHVIGNVGHRLLLQLLFFLLFCLSTRCFACWFRYAMRKPSSAWHAFHQPTF